MKGGQKKEIVGFVRFGVSASERELLQKACALDERNMADFSRIYTMRAASLLLAQVSGKDVRDLVSKAEKSMQDMLDAVKDEVSKKK